MTRITSLSTYEPKANRKKIVWLTVWSRGGFCSFSFANKTLRWWQPLWRSSQRHFRRPHRRFHRLSPKNRQPSAPNRFATIPASNLLLKTEKKKQKKIRFKSNICENAKRLPEWYATFETYFVSFEVEPNVFVLPVDWRNIELNANFYLGAFQSGARQLYSE